ncbi:hypothetical protein BD414DRAFT_580362 [Trametes punicea]|nr:hypothetical protein BD414DRAFT_580362 [Trametes punicea]
MNGTTPGIPQGHHTLRNDVQRSPHISPALLQGAREISAILERRMAALRAEYEQKIQALTRERDELLAHNAAGAALPQEVSEELEALRQERERHSEERARWEDERASWEEERSQWSQEREVSQEKLSRYQKECEELQNTQKELQLENSRMQGDYEQKLQELAASKDASIANLEERIKWLEAAQDAPLEQPTTSLDQNQFDPLDIFCSPQQSPVQPERSSGTRGTASPSRDPVPMQVRTHLSLAFPFDFESELDAILAPLLDAQIDEPHISTPSPPKSPTITLREAHSPPKSPTITLRGGRSPSTTRSPTMFSSSSAPLSSSSAAATGSSSSRLAIRVPPPSTGKVRKSIKPPVTPPTEEERRTIVHVPPMRDSSIEGSPSKSSSGSSSTDSPSTSSP